MFASYLMQTKFFFIALVCLGLLPAAEAQSSAQCLSETLLQQQILENPAANRRRQVAIDLAALQRSQAPEGRIVLTIPVVVHVVWRLPTENISDEQILSQIDVLNEDFRLLNANQAQILPLFQGVKADMELEFELANEDPSGQPSTGIVRAQTTFADIGFARTTDNRRRICYTADGGSDAWCPQRYLNIWIGQFPSGISGEASFPGQDSTTEDGVRIDPEHFGTLGTAAPPYHLGRTATHEIGHFFDLYHLWGGSNDDDPLCQYDDEVADTPEQNYNYRNQCPTGLQVSCGTPDMYQNYLNYTNDACMALFTQGQKARVWAALNGPRIGLLEGGNCTVGYSTAGQQPPPVVFPNPASTQIGIRGLIFEAAISITDARGVLFLHRDRVTNESFIDVSSIPEGVYFIKIEEKKSTTVSRLLIIR